LSFHFRSHFQYMDKSMDFSTAENNAANNLSASGTGVVTVENGVATVPNTATPATLKTTTITDLKELSGYTVYMKVKANGSYSGSWVNLINISGFFRTYISAKKDSAYTLAATQKGNANYAYTYPTELTFTEDQWIYMAYTLDFDGTTGKMTAHRVSDSFSAAISRTSGIRMTCLGRAMAHTIKVKMM